MVAGQLDGLTVDQRSAFEEEYRRRRKRWWLAWPLWLLFSHFAYFGKWWLQLLYWLTLGGGLVWWIVEGLRLPRRLRDHNRDAAIAVMRDLRIIAQ